MKKVRMIILFMTLFLGVFFVIPVKVFADEKLLASEWYNHITQFTFGFAKGEVNSNGDIYIVEEPSHEYDGWFINYYWWHYTSDNPYFEPRLYSIASVMMNNGNVLSHLNQNYEDFDGYFYWNFEQKYWQVEYYETSELDYYIERIEELEDEIQQLENEISSLENQISLLENEISALENQISSLQNIISSLEDEISSLENQISLLEDEIQQLENALDLEYDRGYNDGYEIGYSEGLLVNNNDVDIIKWFVPLVVIIIVVGIIEPIILCKRRG